MTSDEIRELRTEAQKTKSYAAAHGYAYEPPDWLAEIAYQLAVMNEREATQLSRGPLTGWQQIVGRRFDGAMVSMKLADVRVDPVFVAEEEK